MSKTTLHPWQEKMLVDIESGGFKPGEMVIMMSGRQAGKSTFNSAAFKRLWDDIYKTRPVEDLVLTEQKLHGARYYCVEPVGGNWLDMEEWAITTFGPPGEVWPSQDFVWPEVPRWVGNNRKFWFRNERDRTMFIMRWSR